MAGPSNWGGSLTTGGASPVVVVVTGAAALAAPGPVVGYQPDSGEQFTVIVRDTHGDVRPAPASAMSFEYMGTPADSQMQLTFTALSQRGANPIDIATMRELVSYPSLYDRSAVYLGEFDFLLRRNLVYAYQFLSVWNEQIEEGVRGANVHNINRLFVTVVPADGVTQESIEAEIVRIIREADDSMRVSFVPRVIQLYAVSITAWVSVVHDPALVEAQIRQVLIDEYGPGSRAAQRGQELPRFKVIHELLSRKVEALRGSEADFDVVIPADVVAPRPENWRYVDNNSITVSIQIATANLSQFGR